jgi:hypothetical protein
VRREVVASARLPRTLDHRGSLVPTTTLDHMEGRKVVARGEGPGSGAAHHGPKPVHSNAFISICIYLSIYLYIYIYIYTYLHMYMCIYVYKDYTPKRTGRLSRSVRDEAEERRPETARLDDRRFGEVGICFPRHL